MLFDFLWALNIDFLHMFFVGVCILRLGSTNTICIDFKSGSVDAVDFFLSTYISMQLFGR
jgi:hypothetical protein